jgi:hypothetical protein
MTVVPNKSDSERKPRSLREWFATFFDGLLDRLPVL